MNTSSNSKKYILIGAGVITTLILGVLVYLFVFKNKNENENNSYKEHWMLINSHTSL